MERSRSGEDRQHRRSRSPFHAENQRFSGQPWRRSNLRRRPLCGGEAGRRPRYRSAGGPARGRSDRRSLSSDFRGSRAGKRAAFSGAVPQDTIQAGLSGASAVGFGLAFARAYGAAEWTGPWGIVIAAAAARGQMIYDGVKAAHQDEEKIKICLKAAGVKSDRSAGVLGEQMSYQSSVRGHSQLPFLSKIALFENLHLVDWINRLDQDRVDQLSDLVKIELNNGQETPSQYRPQPVSPDVLAQDETSTMKEFERQLILHKLI